MFHRSKIALVLAMGAGLATVSSPAVSGIPKGGLAAITVSNDGKTIYAAGDNRVLYVLNAKNLSVKKRIWIEYNPYQLIMSKNGKMLIMHDSSDRLTFFDLKTFKKKKTIKNAENITIAWKAGKSGWIITTDGGSGRGEKARTKIAAYDLATGKSVMKAKVKGRLNAISSLPDGSKIFGITDSEKSEAEKKEDTPDDLDDLEKLTFREMHDGKVSHIVTLKKNGSEISRYTTWFKPGGDALMKVSGKSLIVVNSSNTNAILDMSGKKTTLFKTESFGHYGYAFSRNGKVLVSGGLRKGAVTNIKEEDSVEFEMPRMGGWPEYFEGFAVGPKGMIYGGTSAYRLIKLSPEGEVLKKISVY